MSMQIEVTIKDVYGKPTIYPACETSETFTKIAKSKSLTEDMIHYIKKLGYTVLIQSPKEL